MKARDLMTASDLSVLVESASVQQAAQLMADNNIGALPVLDDSGKLEGIITDRDICCRVVAEGLDYDTPVREIMTTSVQCVSPDADVQEIEQAMRDRKIRRVPVVDKENRLQGFVALADLFRHLHGGREEHELATVVERISSPD